MNCNIVDVFLEDGSPDPEYREILNKHNGNQVDAIKEYIGGKKGNKFIQTKSPILKRILDSPDLNPNFKLALSKVKPNIFSFDEEELATVFGEQAGFLGAYISNSKTIFINETSIDKLYEELKEHLDSKDELIERVVTHETAHFYTNYLFEGDVDLSKDEIQLRDEIIKVFNKLQSSKTFKDINGPKVDDLEEFIADYLANGSFNKAIHKDVLPEIRTLWQKILDFIFGKQNRLKKLDTLLAKHLSTINTKNLPINPYVSTGKDPLFITAKELELEFNLRHKNKENNKNVYKRYLTSDRSYKKVLAKLNSVREKLPKGFSVKVVPIMPEKGDTRNYVSLQIQPEKNNFDAILDGANYIFQNSNKDTLRYLENELINLNKTLLDINKTWAEQGKKDTTSYVHELAKTEQKIEAIQNFIFNLNKENTINNEVKIMSQWQLDSEIIDSILTKSLISARDIAKVKNLINQWTVISDISGNNNPVFSRDELEAPEIQEELIRISNNLTKYTQKMVRLTENALENFASNSLGREITFADIATPREDMGNIPSWILNAGHIDHPLAQVLFKEVNKANINANIESFELLKNMDKLLDKATESSGMSKVDIFQLMRESWSTGQLTGDLVDVNTPEFNESNILHEKELKELRADLLESTTDYADAKKKYLEELLWKRENVLLLDIDILFPDSDESGVLPSQYLNKQSDKSREDYIQQLKAELGENKLNDILIKQEKLVNNFKRRRLAKFASITDGANKIESSDQSGLFDLWLNQNSPYKALEVYNSFQFKGKKAIPTFNNNLGVSKNKKDRSDAYIKINSNKDLSNLYQQYLNTISIARDSFGAKASWMNENSLITIKASLMDKLLDRHGKITWAALKDSVKSTIREDSIEEDNPTDLKSGKEIKFLQTSLVNDKNRDIELLVVQKTNAFQKTHNRAPSLEETVQLKKDAMHEYAANSSFDIHKLSKALAVASYTYQHKQKIEDAVKLSEDYLMDEYQGLGRSRSGLVLNKQVEGQVENMKRNINFFLNNEFYGYPSAKKQFVTKRKHKFLMTAKEKETLKELDSALEVLENKLKEDPEDEVLLSQQESLNKKRRDLGGHISFGKVLDQLLKFVHLKGLGWNPFSGVANMGFGTISNFTEAADGRSYNTTELVKAYKLVTNSTLRAGSFRGIETPTAKKIKALMDKFDILNMSKNELYTNNYESPYLSKMRDLEPYNMIARAEYFNQAPVLIAMMMHQTATDNKGNTINMWDAYDIEGNLKEDYALSQKGGESAFIEHVNDVIERNHGDYRHMQSIKEGVIGRALVAFRTWMFEGFNNRFGKEMANEARGYAFKGRYRSYGSLFLNDNDEVDFSTGLKNTMFTLAQLLRGLSPWHSTNFDKRLSAIDAANMRKNLVELYFLMGMALFGLLLRKAMDVEDDDDNPYMVNFLLNQGLRVRTDILFYTNPSEFERLNSNIFPAFKLYQDIAEFSDSFTRYFDGRPTTVQTGPLEGMNWVLRETLELTPGTSSILSNYKKVKVQIDK